MQIRQKRLTCSAGGDFIIFVVLFLGGFSALPLVFAISKHLNH